MSKYNKKCTKDELKSSKSSKIKIPPKILNSKAFCDCSRCADDDCPDILNMLSVTVTDTTCRFGSHMASDKSKESPAEKPSLPHPHAVLDEDRDCSCRAVARGLRDDVHMNLGLTELRHRIVSNQDSFVNSCNSELPENAKRAPEDSQTASKKPTTDTGRICGASSACKDDKKCKRCN